MSQLTDEDKRYWRERAAARRRRRLNRWTWVAVSVLLVVPALVAVGAWNPWNLVVVDRLLFHPILGGVMTSAAVTMLLLRLPWAWARILSVIGFLCSTLFAVLGLLVVMSAFGSSRTTTATVASPFNDIEAKLRYHDQTAGGVSIHLEAHRGLWSRRNDGGTIGSTSSGVPPLDAQFMAPDELVVSYEGQIVYRVRFDPHDLSLHQEVCRRTHSEARGLTLACWERD